LRAPIVLESFGISDDVLRDVVDVAALLLE
jgi:hypothetical protein